MRELETTGKPDQRDKDHVSGELCRSQYRAKADQAADTEEHEADHEPVLHDHDPYQCADNAIEHENLRCLYFCQGVDGASQPRMVGDHRGEGCGQRQDHESVEQESDVLKSAPSFTESQLIVNRKPGRFLRPHREREREARHQTTNERKGVCSHSVDCSPALSRGAGRGRSPRGYTPRPRLPACR
jgi:hypothetical protein